MWNTLRVSGILCTFAVVTAESPLSPPPPYISSVSCALPSCFPWSAICPCYLIKSITSTSVSYWYCLSLGLWHCQLTLRPFFHSTHFSTLPANCSPLKPSVHRLFSHAAEWPCRRQKRAFLHNKFIISSATVVIFSKSYYHLPHLHQFKEYSAPLLYMSAPLTFSSRLYHNFHSQNQHYLLWTC